MRKILLLAAVFVAAPRSRSSTVAIRPNRACTAGPRPRATSRSAATCATTASTSSRIIAPKPTATHTTTIQHQSLHRPSRAQEPEILRFRSGALNAKHFIAIVCLRGVELTAYSLKVAGVLLAHEKNIMAQRYVERYNGFEIVVDVVATGECRVRIAQQIIRQAAYNLFAVIGFEEASRRVSASVKDPIPTVVALARDDIDLIVLRGYRRCIDRRSPFIFSTRGRAACGLPRRSPTTGLCPFTSHAQKCE